MSIWTEADIWKYIELRKLKLADVYYKGVARTGCVGCGFGACQLNDNRFDVLYELHPKLYEMVMNFKNNNITYREALRKMLALSNKTLPDESN